MRLKAVDGVGHRLRSDGQQFGRLGEATLSGRGVEDAELVEIKNTQDLPV